MVSTLLGVEDSGLWKLHLNEFYRHLTHNTYDEMARFIGKAFSPMGYAQPHTFISCPKRELQDLNTVNQDTETSAEHL